MQTETEEEKNGLNSRLTAQSYSPPFAGAAVLKSNVLHPAGDRRLWKKDLNLLTPP